MKVLILSPLPPPVGGIASWTVNVLDYFNKEENKHLQIFHQNTAVKSRRITKKIFFHRLKSGIFDTFSILKKFDKNIKNYKPDIIHLTSSASLALFKDLFIIRRAKKNNISVVVHFRFGRIPDLETKKNWEWYLLKAVIKNANFTIVIDKRSFDVLKKNELSNIINIPNPISIELESIAKEKFNNEKKKTENQILFIGHVIPSKGIYELVTACKKIKQIIKLDIIGPYEDGIRNKLMEIAKEKENGNWLNFSGVLEKKEIYAKLKNSTLLVLPSYTEGFPNVILEAMACGCPVVASDVGAIPEMLNINLDNPCGICVPVKNEKELKDEIKKLLKNRSLQNNFSLQAKNEVVNKYTLAVICEKYEWVWKNTV